MTLRAITAIATCLASAGATPAASPGDIARSCPFAGHNCYSDLNLGASRHKLKAALDAGLRFIEIDVNHNPSAGGFVVTHRSRRPPTEPLLADFIKPLWERWSAEPGDHLLIIDFKAGSPDPASRDLHKYLRQHRDVLCSFAPDGTIRRTGPIGVCLTGAAIIGQAYLTLAGGEGELLARRDTGSAGSRRDGMREFFRRRPRPGVSYLTLDWRKITGKSTDPTDYFDWLCEIVTGARRNHYRLRVYTLNARKPKKTDGRLVSGKWDAHWRACVRAGVDMISTDNYALAAEWWRQIGTKLETIER